MSLRNAALAIVLLFLGVNGDVLAKKAPGPESIVAKNYLKPSAGYGKPLTSRFNSSGHATRLYFPEFKSSFLSPRDIAFDFLASNSRLLGVSGDGQDLRLYSEKKSLGGYHYRFQQMWQGVPVFASDVLVNVAFDGTITSVISDYKPIKDIPTIPALAAEDAVNAAVKRLGITETRDNAGSELVVYAGKPRAALCWKVLIPAQKPLGDWQVFVDAISGEIVTFDNIMCFVDGAGYTFNPNPVVSEQNLNLMDSSDMDYPALTEARFDVVLRELNPPQGGYYYLSGPFVNTGPTSNRAHFSDPDSFYFNRHDDRFEEVVVYYQIDSCARYYEALGFDDIMQYSVSVAVNGTSDDNSWFSPGQNRITYGYGGVDDAEDGDVIIHEYGHATQFNQVPNWGQTEEGGSMGEGFGDYLTVGFFHPLANGFREVYVFDWDANPRDHFWPGRRVDSNKHYPEDMQYEVHADGEIWSRCLWDIQNGIGNDTTVQLVLQSHFYLTSQANFDDGANAIIDADINLYGGRHLLPIGQAFVDRGILSELPIELEISHSPLGDIENVNGPYPLLASMTHTFPIDSALVYYRFGTDTAFTMLMMAPTANPDEYSAQVPGPGQPSNIDYFLRAVDSLGVSTNLPPDTTFSFFAGPDTIFPVITHQPLNDFPDVSWPPIIYATVTDNIGVDSVWVEFRIADGPWISAPLAAVDTTDVWRGALSGSVVPGDSVEYRIGAKDSSSNHNVTYLPASGYYSFEILEMQVVTRYADGFAIPDLGGRLDTLIITDRMQIYELHAYVDIDHPFIGDLYIFLQSPRNRRILLHNRTGGDGDSIVGWYPDDLLPDTGSFESVVGDSSQGRWLFYVADFRSGGAGVLNTWGLRIVGTGVVDDVKESGASLPEAFYLHQNYPNPFNPSTRISFGLSETGHARLEVFDILGRRVATLLDREMSAGLHSVEWDGDANDGKAATSGIYFARLTSGRESKVIRMSLLK